MYPQAVAVATSPTQRKQTNMNNILRTAFLAATCGALIGQTQGNTIITGGNETLAWSFAQGYTQGFDFTPTANLILSDLGLWDNNLDGMGGGFDVALWDTTSQGLLAIAFINDSDALDPSLTIEGGQYRYESVMPVALTAGTTYTLGVYWNRILTDSESLGLDSPIPSDSNLVLGAYRRYESGGAINFPDSTANTYLIGNLNAKFSLASGVPDGGATFALLGMGLGLMGFARSKMAR